MPLLVQLGASVTLPCSVDTPIPLHELEVQWMRDSGSLVHLFLGGESRPESQSPAYSGRAEFFTEEISKGNFSLLLRNVTTKDREMYKCIVHTEHESSETNVTIDTERLVVTGADVPVFAYAGEDVILNCSVDTHVPLGELEVEWMKTNEEILVLLFMEGRYRPESQRERFRGRAEFFIEEIPKGNFSMKLRDVKTEDRGEFMCIVHTDRESVNATAYVQEPGRFTMERLVVTGADVPVFAYAGEDVILSCSVDTHVPLGELEVEWMKTNEEIQVLLFMEGRYRPESQRERFRGRAEFFSEEIPKGNFSMKLRDVKTEDRGEFMCIVHTDRESVNATVYVQEPGKECDHILNNVSHP
ncbi:butyrophilin-like protein 2 [Conger conger]|uniref:butyrophilin-like protein 2 n=1 Tax=Conger conger TaxID=82655 RepID=UPI002A5A79CF|nr:butyrophilin-like protein 2 [Conger conger]